MPGSPTESFDCRLHRFALLVVAVGVLVSLIAAVVHWLAEGVVATAMLKGTAFAIVAAYPVWRAYRQKVVAGRQSSAASA